MHSVSLPDRQTYRGCRGGRDDLESKWQSWVENAVVEAIGQRSTEKEQTAPHINGTENILVNNIEDV